LDLLQRVGRGVARIGGGNSRIIQFFRPAYETLLDWSSRGQGIPWPINGVYFRVDPRYRRQLGHSYDPKVAEFLRNRLKPGSVCLNVGANVGVYALQFANWAGPTGRVIAFEPNPEARSVLLKHLRLNSMTDRVSVVPAAVGGCAGEAVLFAAGADGMSRLGDPNPAIAHRVRPITVPVVTLNEFCETRGLKPDWILIDIEGFEIAALAGARGLIARFGRELGIIIEMHPNAWGCAGSSRGGAESLLDDLGLSPIPLSGQTDPMSEHGLVFLEAGHKRFAKAALLQVGVHATGQT
jgi:FkbM family methyltransferase